MRKPNYYIAIGASAGGLEALESLFKSIPEDTGATFIVIQHLSPDYKSLMDELLARHTRMQIKIAENNMETESNTIYLIPPRVNLSIVHGKLQLEVQESHSYLNLPINIFFTSLAKDQGKKSVGIVLSGTGSDGSIGVRAIKDAGGLVIAQDEESAKFDGMPRSSISTGIVDFVLPPEKIWEELNNYIKSPSLHRKLQKELTEYKKESLDHITRISIILKNYCGIDFSFYKENTIIRRLERRMKITKSQDIEEYLKKLKESNSEKETLYREFLIGVTSFFRDKDAFDSIKKNILPRLDFKKPLLRVWSAGCSTGEEVYSIAILLREHQLKNNYTNEIKIFATDIDEKSLEIAGQAFYLDNIMADVDPEYLEKHFTKVEGGYKVNENIRKMIVFAKHNILKDPPFSKLDFLICRNLFIYLKPTIQQNILRSFYYSLFPNGVLMMGSSESLGDIQPAFDIIDSKWKIYSYKKGYRAPIESNIINDISFVKNSLPNRNGFIAKSLVKSESLLIEALSATLPPSILVDGNDNIIHVIGDVSEYLTIQPGRFSNNFNSNLDKDLALFVNNIIRRLKNKEEAIYLDNVFNYHQQKKSLTLKGYKFLSAGLPFYLISFIKESSGETSQKVISLDLSKETKERVKELEYELQLAREGLQATIEELETSNEELQSSNEELIASNEELQSTNEELQSVNEELYTVNNEYQNKIEELTSLNDDLNNLLKNTDVGALYIDTNLCIRRISSLVSKITNIVEADIGRPIRHISVFEEYDEFFQDIEYVIDTLHGIEKEVVIKKKRWLVKIRPYRTGINSIEGLIVTFVDISALVNEKERTALSETKMQFAISAAEVAWWELNLSDDSLKYSEKMATMLGYVVEEFPNTLEAFYELIHESDVKRVKKSLTDHLRGNFDMWDVSFRIKKKDETYAIYHKKGKIIKCGKDDKPLNLTGVVVKMDAVNNNLG